MAKSRRKSRPGKRRFYSQGVRVGAVIALTTGFSFAYVWLSIQIVGLGYDIKKEEGRLKLYRERSDALKLKISRLKAPRRIEELVGNESQDFIIPDERRIVRMKGEHRIRQLALMERDSRRNL